MSSESELRDALHASASASPRGIDTDAVVRRARSRRAPKQFAASSVSVLAVAGVVALGIMTLPSLQQGQDAASNSEAMTSMQEPSLSDDAGGSAEKHFDARAVSSNLCGMPTTIAAHNSVGLELAVRFPSTAVSDAGDIDGTVILTNSGTTQVKGTTPLEPVVTVSRDGMTVWHSNPVLTSPVVPIDLAPGQSYSFDASFTPVECGLEDEEGERFRDDLEALQAGRYELSAEIVLYQDVADSGAGSTGNAEGGSDTSAVLVGSDSRPIELR